MATETIKDNANANSNENDEKKQRGGPRGPRGWRPKPTPRERVMTQSLSAFIKAETGRDVSPETVRAVRHCLRPWNMSEETTQLRKNMDRRLEKAKLQDKREKALALLREAESELQKYAGTNELDEDEDEDEDDEDEDSDEYTDDIDDGDDEDVFGDSQKVKSEF